MPKSRQNAYVNPLYHKLLGSLLLLLVSARPVLARITNPVLPPEYGSGAFGSEGGALAAIFANLWRAGLIFAGIFFIVYFIYGAIEWLTGSGEKARVEEGRQKITNSLIGLVIMAASVAIIQLIGKLLNIDFLENLVFTLP